MDSLKFIPLLVPDVPDVDAITPHLRQIDSAKWYTNFGPLVAKLESGLANILNTPRDCISSVANCTLGLELTLSALNLAPQAKVLLPALTFAASATAVLRSACIPVLADIHPDTWLLTPEIARAALAHSRFDCVMPVAAFGCPQPTSGWDAFSRETGIPVVIDAAGAFGNQLVGDVVTVVFSFHATKGFSTGEGGLVASRNAGLIGRVRQLSNFGIDLSRGVAGFAGTNAKMSEYHAAVGLAALENWPESKRRRQKLSTMYRQVLVAEKIDFSVQDRPEDGIYTILQGLLPPGVDVSKVANQLRSRGIETRSWYLPLLPFHPAFSGCEIAGQLPVSLKISPRMLGLPFHLGLEVGDIQAICKSLSMAIAE